MVVFLAIEDSLGCEFALSLILSLYSTLNQTFLKFEKTILGFGYCRIRCQHPRHTG